MLIPQPKVKVITPVQLTITQQQYVDNGLLPQEQVKKFTEEYTDLLFEEALKEAREPEEELLIKNVFDALHNHNVMKLLQYLHGMQDRSRIFYALKKQLLAIEDIASEQDLLKGLHKIRMKHKPTKYQTALMDIVVKKEVSLITLVSLR